ncbi:MAG: hypothetical protein LBF97_02935, partial [Elusimicrobiota bacterium]|nr:hypothetical protein [Elusimicrobiota bacterium]
MSISPLNLLLNSAGILNNKVVKIYKTQSEDTKKMIALQKIEKLRNKLDGENELAQTQEILQELQFLEASVIDESKITEHPIEDGSIVSDYKIQLPIEINLTAVMPSANIGNYGYNLNLLDGARFNNWRKIYQELKDLKTSQDKLIIKTKSDSYFNMILVGIPHDEKVENVNRLVFTLKFKEVFVVLP